MTGKGASPLHEPVDAAKDPETQTSFCFCFVCLFLFHLEPVSGWFWMSDCVLSICRVWFQCSSSFEDRADDRERSASPLHEQVDAAKDPETQTSFCFCFVCLFLFHLEPVSSMSGWFWMSDCVLSICRVWFQCSSFCRDHISGSC